jgi:hypothetical protein
MPTAWPYFKRVLTYPVNKPVHFVYAAAPTVAVFERFGFAYSVVAV